MPLTAQELTEAATPPIVTLPLDPKLVPYTAMLAPADAVYVDKAVIVGTIAMGCGEPAVWPLTFTQTVCEPGFASLGIMAEIEVFDQETTAALLPPIKTEPVPWLAPKLPPLMVRISLPCAVAGLAE